MKFRRIHALVGGLASLAVVLTACGTALAGSPTTGSQRPTVTATETATQTEVQTATATATATVTATPAPPPPPATTSQPAPPPSTEAPPPPQEPDPAPPQGSDQEIHDEVLGAFDVSNTSWSNLFGKWEDPNGNPVQWWVPALYDGDGFYDSAAGGYSVCGRELNTSPNASFCPDGPHLGAAGTGTVMWDMQFFRQYGIGDGSYYVTVAHELGHAGQERFIFDRESGAVPVSSVGQENQADCIAGATLGRAAQDGYLTIEDGDLDEITEFLKHIADGVTHGTPQERVGSFYLGYDSGDIESCLFNQGVAPSGWIGPR